jgi:hypothetical protein
MPEPYWLPDWALVPAKTGPRDEYLLLLLLLIDVSSVTCVTEMKNK